MRLPPPPQQKILYTTDKVMPNVHNIIIQEEGSILSHVIKLMSGQSNVACSKVNVHDH